MKTNSILWDFDGVILNSNEVRDLGFERVLADYPKDKVQKLIEYHQSNGGLSRYKKFRYFYEEILFEELSNERLNQLCESFSEIMRSLLVNPRLLNIEVLNFIKEKCHKYNMHIVSGSDHVELNYLCKELSISEFFISINGSPTPKIELVSNLLENYHYEKENCILIGDSINDHEAANANGINFFGFNNEKLRDLNLEYLDKIESIENYL